MWAQRAAAVLAIATTTVGVVLVAHGTLYETATLYRVGLAVLVIGLAWVLDRRSHRNMQRLMDHQARVARLAVHERQQYAEMGWRAARLEISGNKPVETGDAKIVDLPAARSAVPRVRKNGSAY